MDGWKKAVCMSFEILYPYVIYVCVTAGISVWMSETDLGESGYALLLSAVLTSVWLFGIYNRKYGVRRISLKKVALAMALACSACLVFNLLLLSESGVKSSREIYENGFGLQILAAGIFCPIVEELIFRGLGYRKLREILHFFPAAFVSSVLFGLYHGHLAQGIYAGGMGFLFAWLAESENGILSPITAHIAANLLSLTLTKAGAAEWLMESGLRRARGIAAAGVLFLLCFCLKRREDRLPW